MLEDTDPWSSKVVSMPRNGMAIAGLFLGMLSIFGGFTSFAGLACSSVGVARAKSRGCGFEVSVVGFVLSLLGLGILTLIVCDRLGYYSLFYYQGEGKVDDARASLVYLDKAYKAYMLKNDGIPPVNLQELITPPDGGRPFIEGGSCALLDPWGVPYQYDALHKLPNGTPDPVVFTIDPTTKRRFTPPTANGKPTASIDG